MLVWLVVRGFVGVADSVIVDDVVHDEYDGAVVARVCRLAAAVIGVCCAADGMAGVVVCVGGGN